MKTFSKLLRERDGNAMIEVAVFFSVLMLLLFGTVDFGMLLNQYLRVCDSTRAAAEAATLRANAGAANATTIQSIATSSAAGIPHYAVTTSYYCMCGPAGGTVSCASHSSCGSYGIPNQYIQVTATAQLPLIFHVQSFASTFNVQSIAIARTPWTGTN